MSASPLGRPLGRRPWTVLYPSTVAADLSPTWHTMDAAARATIERLPDAPAVHFAAQFYTWRDIDSAADAVADGLGALGLRPGDRIGIYLQNDPQWIVVALAAWRSGATVVALNPMLREKELGFQLRDSGARFLVCLAELLPIVHTVEDRGDLGTVITTSPDDLATDRHPGTSRLKPAENTAFSVMEWAEMVRAGRDHTHVPVPAGPDDVALLTYTSGTTGRAKGAMNLHRNLAHSAAVYTTWFDIDESDAVLGVAPMFHITGAVAVMCVSLYSGAPAILMHRFDAAETLAVIERHRATFTVAASTAFIALINEPDLSERDVSSLTKIASGGAPVSPALVERIREHTGWHIRGVYGLTETTSPTHLVPPDRTPPVHDRSGALSVGIPVPGADVKIVDVDTGAPLDTGEEGEVVVRGPMVVPGYWQASEESAHAFRDDWLYTGDVGVIDETGWLFIVDRKKDLINAGGYKVWPREVEDVLYQHPAVKEAAVVGIPDEYRGETVKAYVSLVSEASVSEADLIAFCKARMAAYKYPRYIDIVPDLPKNASGKILRRELRDSGTAG